jgi:hypothetical protein
MFDSPQKNHTLKIFKLSVFIIIILQFSCGQKYKMANMQGQEIDVTQLVNSGKFKTSYCQGRLDRLIEIDPISIDLKYENDLQKQYAFWVSKYNQVLKNKNADTISHKFENLSAKTKYQYSYVIDRIDNPIKVYRTDITINGDKQLRLFLRVDNHNRLFENDYRTNNWITNNCDSINSIITDLL